jgi:TPR repeat protein
VQKLILGIIGSIILFSGCANRDVAKHYLQEGKIDKAYNIYSKWAKIDNPKANLNLAKLDNNDTKKIDYALKAYKGGEQYAANILENIYFNKGELKKAKEWYKKADLNNSTAQDFNTHLSIITTLPTIKQQVTELKKIKNLANHKNVYAANALGKFYENTIYYFYDLNKSEYYYKIGHKNSYIPASINLGTLYIFKLNKEKEGLKILKNTAPKDNGVAAYTIAKFLIKKLDENLIKFNTPCITCSFKTPSEFFRKKLYLLKYRDKYISQSVKPWLDYSYKKGYIKAKFYLISLDVKYDKFLTKKTYSNLTLKEAIAFLHNFEDKFFGAKMVLANIYYKYAFLNMYPLSKNIYAEYAQFDKTGSFWHLYQYYKKYHPNNPKKEYYLNYLVKNNFTPAIIENAYFQILNNKNVEKNKKVLLLYSKQNNILALTYYTSILTKENSDFNTKCKWYKKLCKYTPLNKTTDLKIANLYEKQNNILKAATIYKFYSDLNDSTASYKLAMIYKSLCNKNRYKAYLEKLKTTTNENIKITYAIAVLNGEIKDNKSEYLTFIKNIAKKDNLKASLFLANLYANGIYVDFNPELAEKYYNKAIKTGNKQSVYFLISLYNKININHKFDNKIVNLYQKAIKYNLPKAKVNFAAYLIDNGNIPKAINLLKQENDPKAKYLLYKLTGKMKYIHKANKTNYGRLLLVYAKKNKYNPRKALLYTFRAALCNTGGAMIYAYELMKRINSPKIINSIYNKAKQYPKCENY